MTDARAHTATVDAVHDTKPCHLCGPSYWFCGACRCHISTFWARDRHYNDYCPSYEHESAQADPAAIEPAKAPGEPVASVSHPGPQSDTTEPAPRKRAARWEPWTMRRALDFIRLLELSLSRAGYHVGMTGGVLYCGNSTKDLDIIVYPRCRPAYNPGSTSDQDQPDREAVYEALERVGMEPWLTAQQLQEHWRKAGSLDTKHVEVWTIGNRRVDVMFLM